MRIDRRRRGTFSRPPLARMMLMHERLKAGRYPNCRKLADELEVSSKTVQRDLEFMRDRLGLPIEYDQLHFGFYYAEPVTHFPTIEVSEGEIVALLVAQKALQQYKGTPFEKALRTAFAKISEGLRDKISFPWSDLDAAISFRSAGHSVADLELFESASRAVLRSLEVEFEYRKLGGKGFEKRRVQPYHLGCVENLWYLFGFDEARKQLRTFALTRMRKLRSTGARFRRPAEFSIGRFLSESFGVFTGREKQTVRIRFDAFAGQLVQERSWHPSQKIKRLRDGGIKLILEVSGLEEIERWVLSWGAHAEVVEPRALREIVRRTASSMGALYAGKAA